MEHNKNNQFAVINVHIIRYSLKCLIHINPMNNVYFYFSNITMEYMVAWGVVKLTFFIVVCHVFIYHITEI